jgi:hypothetical protein
MYGHTGMWFIFKYTLMNELNTNFSPGVTSGRKSGNLPTRTVSNVLFL